MDGETVVFGDKEAAAVIPDPPEADGESVPVLPGRRVETGIEKPDGCCVPAGLCEEDACASEGAGIGESGTADALVSGAFVGFTFGVEDGFPAGFAVGVFVGTGDRVPAGVSLGSADGDAEADGTPVIVAVGEFVESARDVADGTGVSLTDVGLPPSADTVPA